MKKLNQQLDIYLQKAIRENLSKMPSPSVTLKRHLSKSYRQPFHNNMGSNDIFFDITIKTKTSNIILVAYNKTTDKIFNHKIVSGSPSNKLVKEFVVETLINLRKESIKINKVYLPRRITSVFLTNFLAYSFSDIEIIWYLNLDLRTLFKHYYSTFKKDLLNTTVISKNLIKESISDFNNLTNNHYLSEEKYLEIAAAKKVNKLPLVLNRSIHTSTKSKDRNEVKKLEYGWQSFSSKTEYDCITNYELLNECNKFTNFYSKNYEEKFIAVNVKIKFALNQEVRSLGKANITTLADKEQWFNIVSTFLDQKDILAAMSFDDGENTISNFPNGIILFDFKPLNTIKDTKYAKYELPLKRKITVKDINKVDYNSIDLPKNMDVLNWDGVTFNKDLTLGTFTLTLKDKNKSYDVYGHILKGEFSNSITLQRANNNSIQKLFTFTDTIIKANEYTTFKRVIVNNGKNITYLYENSKLIYTATEKNFGFITKIQKDTNLNLKNICTLDIETRKNSDNNLVPICMSYLIEDKTRTFLFKGNWEEDMLNAFKTLLKSGNNNKKFYVHNLSHFDGIFILDTLSKLGKLKIIKRDNKIMNIQLSFKITEKGPEYKIKFYDSLLILPSSLDSLGNAFKVEDRKSIFPMKFVDGDRLDFNYEGAVPPYNSFYNANTDKFTREDYNNYCNKFDNNNWNLVQELTKYCERDCITLRQVLIKFSTLIFDLFYVDITKYPTLSSIAYAIFRTNFLEEDTITNITCNKLHFILSDAYMGGFCDNYIAEGKNIHSYDINSLYPSAMSKFDMPTGTPIHIIGDPYKYTNNPFGFVYADIEAPYLKVPILPTRVQTSGGVRTVSAVGTWSGWYFLEELKNAEQHGYKFNIKEAYLFERRNVFKKYILALYEIKINHSPDDPIYFIAKLLMNSLYGRFGMNPITEKCCIVTPEESEKIISKYDNVEVTPLPSGNVLLQYKLEDRENNKLNISVVISAAIAAYSRIEMTEYMIKYSDNLYSIDTDGIKLDKELDEIYVSDKQLGKMKHEYTFKDAVFIAPKVYGGTFDKPYKNRMEMTKVKGLKTPIPFDELKKVLQKEHIKTVYHEKFFKELSLSTIKIVNQVYSLKISSYKRVLVFNTSDKLIYTLPLQLKNGEIISKDHITLSSQD